MKRGRAHAVVTPNTQAPMTATRNPRQSAAGSERWQAIYTPAVCLGSVIHHDLICRCSVNVTRQIKREPANRQVSAFESSLTRADGLIKRRGF